VLVNLTMKAAIRCIISENPRFPSQTALANPGIWVLNSAMRKEAYPFFTKRIERLSSSERWFAAILFAFKLFAAAMIVVPLIWRMTLSAKPSFYVWDSFAEDLSYAVQFMSPLCFLTAVIILIGGIIQLLSYSRGRGAWSIVFGVLVLAAGIFMACHVPSHIENLKLIESVA